jgi:hypothetical protein
MSMLSTSAVILPTGHILDHDDDGESRANVSEVRGRVRDNGGGRAGRQLSCLTWRVMCKKPREPTPTTSRDPLPRVWGKHARHFSAGHVTHENGRGLRIVAHETRV